MKHHLVCCFFQIFPPLPRAILSHAALPLPVVFCTTFLHGTGGSTYFATPFPPRRLPDSSGAYLLVGSLPVGNLSCRAGSANIRPPNATLTTRCSGAMLHTPSKQSTLPRGAAAQRCIPQVNISITAWCSGATLHPPTIRSALPVDIPINYPACSTLVYLPILQPTLRSALPVDIPTDYPPLYSACRYDN
jgi:hypothetical protein